MDDGELLEAAANAAGIDHRHLPHVWPRFEGDQWNPLVCNSDAFQLMVKLGLEVHFIEGGGVDVLYFSERDPIGEIIGTEFMIDRCAMTRLAIVRAAAEIGRHKRTSKPEYRAKRDTANPCRLCGWSAHMAIHADSDGLQSDDPHLCHRYQPPSAAAAIGKAEGEGEGGTG